RTDKASRVILWCWTSLARRTMSAQAVVTFLALLELSKESLVELTQAECYAPIYARLSYTPI
ncbi:MAG: hypothetical protein EBX54_05305, partial [Betaproteobacteria bacterium]|nr:hypothetical protein [Betaproteobacteria bacterium]